MSNPRGLTLDHYLDVAVVYNEAKVREGRPIQAVADKFSVPYDTAARWVKTTRSRGIPLVGEVCRGQCPKCCPSEQVASARQANRERAARSRSKSQTDG